MRTGLRLFDLLRRIKHDRNMAKHSPGEELHEAGYGVERQAALDVTERKLARNRRGEHCKQVLIRTIVFATAVADRRGCP